MSRKRKRYPKEVIDCPACEGSGKKCRRCSQPLIWNADPPKWITDDPIMALCHKKPNDENDYLEHDVIDCDSCEGTGKQEREYEPEFDKEEALDRLNDEDHPE